MAPTYSPRKNLVPSAMRGLTALFGMGRGEHPRQKHHKKVSRKFGNNKLIILGVVNGVIKKIKAYGQLVLLGFTVTSFTPIAYQRHSL